MCLMQIVVGIHRTRAFSFSWTRCWKTPATEDDLHLLVIIAPPQTSWRATAEFEEVVKVLGTSQINRWAQTSHTGQFSESEIYTSSELIIFPLMYGLLWLEIWENLESEGAKKSKYWEITFKVVQMKFLAMHITNQKLSFDIFMIGHLQNIFMEHDLYLISLWFLYNWQIYLCCLWLLSCSRDTYRK